MTTPQFADLSQFQPANIDWQAYKQWSAQGDGISRVALRSSYGVGYKDVHFAQYRQGALNAGIDQIIFYHYAYPSLNPALLEANSQFNIVGSVRPQDILILDFEENVDAANSAWAFTWLTQQELNYGGKLPGIYASSAYIQQRLQDARLARYPLWLANWQFTPDERPPVPKPWASYEFVQYTDRATNVPGIQGTVDADIFLGVTIQPEDQPIVIDLTNSTVASHFTGDNNQWTCKETKFTLHGEILAFYQRYGGNALCGLTYLGLPLSGETPVPNKPGVVWQAFERGVLAFDPNHVIDNPPGSGRVYLLHIDKGLGMDPRIGQLSTQNAALTNQVTTLQGENAALKALPIVANLDQIQAIGKTVKQTINDDIDLIMKLATVI
jgi:GH25 family lysozyme M1 (1,4-beta-N-acetylmuramidase)